LVNENGLLSLSLSLSILQYFIFIFIFFKIPQTLFVSNSHQTHLMREIWWHFHT
jgi:hypothetical protein